MTDTAPLRLFIHVEEPSMEAALETLLPRLLIDRSVEWKIIEHQSKQNLLKNLPARLRGYASRLTREDIRVLIAIDRDNDDCHTLKSALEAMARQAGLPTKTSPDHHGRFRVVNRIIVEELEAWFFGDIPALRAAYPGVPPSLPRKYLDPDAIKGGTWEALFRVLQQAGHFPGERRLPKIAVARAVGQHMSTEANRSASFRAFVEGLHALIP